MDWDGVRFGKISNDWAKYVHVCVAVNVGGAACTLKEINNNNNKNAMSRYRESIHVPDMIARIWYSLPTSSLAKQDQVPTNRDVFLHSPPLKALVSKQGLTAVWNSVIMLIFGE